MLEDGAYRRLLDLYYTRETTLPANLDLICRLIRARSPEETAAVVIVLDEFFALTDSGYQHKRCDAEIARTVEKSAKAAGSAKCMWNGKRTHSERIADAERTHEERIAFEMLPNTQYPIPNKEEEIHVPSGDVVRVFDHWKSVHAKPRSKLDEKRKKLIRTALKIHSADDLCRCIDGYKRSPFHQGKNERATIYDDIELFLRDAKKIEAGLALADGSSGAQKWL